MKLRDGLLLATLFACGSTKANSGPETDAGPASDTGTAVDAAGDAVDAEALYEEAVLAAKWQAVANAPSLTGGAKQDDIYFPSTTVGYAVSGQASSVYKTTDGGTTWTAVFTHAGTYFRSVLFVDEDHGFASNIGPLPSTGITDTTVLYSTTDGGMTWNPVTAITGPMPSGICNQTMSDPQHLFAIGRANGPCYLMTSSNGGTSWTSIDMNTQFQDLIDVRFTTPTNGIVVGGSAGSTEYCTIMHTGDGGATWQTVFTSKTANSLCWKINFPTDDVGYVSVQDEQGGPPTFAKTTDGGMTWTEMALPNNSQGLYPGIGIGFITPDIGWASADDPTLPTYRTTNGGKTWQTDSALVSPINRFRFLSPTTAFAIGATIWKLDVNWTGGDP